ncbi:MAG: hypothetical protein WC242_01820 [Candidatus Paceibacterota bacterium]|jgi:hypothetical protein
MKQPSSVEKNTPMALIRQNLFGWLDKKDWTTQELVDWLTGYKLLEILNTGCDDEPYGLIVKALEDGVERNRKRLLKDELARRIAKLLNEGPDVNGPCASQIRNDQLLYNLLLLAACIKRYRTLQRPLCDMRQRGKLINRNYLAISLKRLLDDAISHQYK